MQTFKTWDDLEIAYHQWGEPGVSPPVVLHHGFVADAEANWVTTGVVQALVDSGHRVVAPDARGHGHSDKPHDPARYGEQRMARDLELLVELIDEPQVDVVGYSMGAIVSLIFASASERVRRLVVGGVGSGVIECGGVDRRAVSNESLLQALATEDPATIETEEAQAFRRLADAVDADRQALVAQASSVFRGGIALDAIGAPTLVLAGDRDPLAIRPQVLADAIPGATLELVSGDHMTALADPRFRQAIVDFLR